MHLTESCRTIGLRSAVKHRSRQSCHHPVHSRPHHTHKQKKCPADPRHASTHPRCEARRANNGLPRLPLVRLARTFWRSVSSFHGLSPPLTKRSAALRAGAWLSIASRSRPVLSSSACRCIPGAGRYNVLQHSSLHCNALRPSATYGQSAPARVCEDHDEVSTRYYWVLKSYRLETLWPKRA